jgi:hypothetical protein
VLEIICLGSTVTVVIPAKAGDPVDAGVGVYRFPAFAGMTAVQAAKMIATNPPCIAIFCPTGT